MARDFDPFGSKALERALAGQRAFEAAMESQRRIQAFLQPPTLAEIHARQQLMDTAWERQRLFEQSWEAQRALEGVLEERQQVERMVADLVRPTHETARLLDLESQSVETALAERNSLMKGLDEIIAGQRWLAEFTRVPEDLISTTRLAEEAYAESVRLRDLAAQFDSNREAIDQLIATSVPSLPDVPAEQVATRLSESLSATLAAAAEAEESETRVYGAAAVMRFAVIYRRSIESLPAEWHTPAMQVALVTLQVTLISLLLMAVLGIISLIRPHEGPTLEQIREFKDGVLVEEKRQTALAQHDSAMADSVLAEERKQSQLLEAILQQGKSPPVEQPKDTAK